MEQVLEKLGTFLAQEEELLRDYAVDVAESFDGESYASNQKDYFAQKGRVAAIKDSITLVEDSQKSLKAV